MLTPEQTEIVDKIIKGENVIITGNAGTGKSFLIKHLMGELEGKKVVGLTAMTGMAAVLIGGSTVHSYCGVGIMDRPVGYYVYKLSKTNNPAGERIRKTDILIIDEFSMQSEFFFDNLTSIIASVRKRPIQYVFCGDPKQLPPVVNSLERDESKGRFCFESEKFEEIFKDNVFILKKNFRQVDQVYSKLIDDISIGVVTEPALERLKTRIRKKNMNNDVIHLYGTNSEVYEHNSYRFNKIPEETREYTYSDEFIREGKMVSRVEREKLMDRLASHSRFQTPTVVKKKAFVMCLTNISTETGWVNGTTGYVLDYVDGYPLVCKSMEKSATYLKENKTYDISLKQDTDYHLFDESILDVIETKIGKAIRRGVPLGFAWARTVHKSQGSEFDRVYICGSAIQNSGQAYVALSRVKSIEGLELSCLPRIKVNHKAVEFLEKYQGTCRESEQSAASRPRDTRRTQIGCCAVSLLPGGDSRPAP
jgi:ATP-dependent DNA helicase PIF1